jgi:hypothetical protein
MTTDYTISVTKEPGIGSVYYAEVWDSNTGKTLHTTEFAESPKAARRLAVEWCGKNLEG